MDSSARWARLTRIVRSAVHDLFDQSEPFGRLALVHTIFSVGTTFVTISLAGTLFFTISPEAAKGKVVLYLLLTITPFAVVAPALSPLLDRGSYAPPHEHRGRLGRQRRPRVLDGRRHQRSPAVP